MKVSDIDEAIRQARASRLKLPPGAITGLEMEQAYSLGLKAFTREKPGAIKLGGTNKRTRALFNVSRPYFGSLFASEVFESGAKLLPGNFVSPSVEPEIVVAFNRPLRATSKPRDTGVLLASLDWVAIGLEVPDTVLTDPPTDGVAALLADRCAAGALVVGERQNAAVLDELERAPAKLEFNAETVSQREPECDLIGGVLGAVRDALSVLGEYECSVPAGVIIATGGLAPAIPLRECTCVTARLGESSVSFEVSGREK
ncbi:MAG: hypothetical protein QUV02_10805 [Maricaulis sp.]|uniref:hypothetical protein n=1 Tax=Maricaulis sp. TaxID=1486257 RepID=UPI00262CFA51|nr:hypothetical protein [Maricaulis sp.]MDM7984932.1 hypothetical protein [Maricaulis sp.]